MDLLCSVNWIALLVLAITLLLFKVLNQLAMKINWTFVVLISMVMGAVIGTGYPDIYHVRFYFFK